MPRLIHAICIVTSIYYHALGQEGSEKSYRNYPLISAVDSLQENDEYATAITRYGNAANFYLSTSDYPAYVYCLNQMSRCYGLVSDEINQSRMLRLALEAAAQHLEPEHPEVSFSYTNLGNYYWNRSKRDPDSSFAAFRKAIQISERSTPENHIYRYYSYRGIARNYYRVSNFEQAIAFNQKSIDILKMNPGSNLTELGKSYYDLGVSLRGAGETLGARLNYETAIRILGTQKSNPVRNSLLYRIENSLANTYVDEKDYATARDLYRKIIESVPGKSNPDLIRPHANIAVAYAEDGDFELALHHIEQAIRMEPRNNQRNEERLADNYVQYSYIYSLMEAPDSAIIYAQKALDLYRKLYKDGNLATAGCFKFIALSYALRSDFKLALENIQQAIIESDTTFNNSDPNANPVLSSARNYDGLYELLAAKANILYRSYKQSNDRKELENSYNIYLILDSLTNEIRRGMYSQHTKLIISAALKKEAENALNCIYDMVAVSDQPGYLSLAYNYMEKNRYAQMFENLSSVQAVSSASLPDSLRKLEQDLQFRFASQKLGLASAQNQSLRDSITQEMYNTNSKNQELKNYLVKQYPSYYQSKYGEILQLDSIQLTIDNKTQFLEYFLGKSSLAILSITRDNINIKLVPYSDALFRTLEAFLIHISNPIDLLMPMEEVYSYFSSNSFEIYKQLVEPVLLPGITRLIISPDGFLSKLPFEVLLTSNSPSDFKTAPYLLRNLDIQYAYNLNLLQKLIKPAVSKTPSLLAFSYSDVNSKVLSTRGGRNEIPATARELQAINKFFSGEINKFLIGEEATETAFKNLSSGYELIHLAVHGTGDTAKAINSRLEFKAENDSLNDGKLYAHELYNLNFDKLKLAVLSACETGIGKELPGEGVFSIARGFAYAGCPAIVMSLWQVNDTYTAKLMEYFYANLAEGLPVDEAIRSAKLSFIENAESMEAFPYYWASFIAQGEVSPVVEPHFKYNYLVFIFLSLIIVGTFLYTRRK